MTNDKFTFKCAASSEVRSFFMELKATGKTPETIMLGPENGLRELTAMMNLLVEVFGRDHNVRIGLKK